MGISKKLPQLSYIGYQQVAPAAVLQEYVQCYWIMRRDNPLLTLREEFLHPDGGLGIIFNLGDAFYFNGQIYHPKIRLGGPGLTVTKLGLQGTIHAIGVRFHPGGAYPFLKVPVHELTEKNIRPEELDLKSSGELYERLNSASSTAEKIAHIERWLVGLLLEPHEAGLVVKRSLELIKWRQGQIVVPEVADRLAISQRQLERLYQTWVGLSPKAYARLVRVARARNALQRVDLATTADIAYLAGFYDQAHFIREFKAVEGITPSLYRAKSLARPSPAARKEDLLRLWKGYSLGLANLAWICLMGLSHPSIQV